MGAAHRAIQLQRLGEGDVPQSASPTLVMARCSSRSPPTTVTGVGALKPGCGNCPTCCSDHSSYCHEFFPRNFFGTRPDGSTALSTADGDPVFANIFGQSSFATHAICHERNTVVVPADLDLRIAGPLGCGTCGIVGAAAPGTMFQADVSHLMSGGRAVRGIVEGDADPKTFIPQLVALHQSGRFPFDRLIRLYPFESIIDAFEDSHSGAAIKPDLLF